MQLSSSNNDQGYIRRIIVGRGALPSYDMFQAMERNPSNLNEPAVQSELLYFAAGSFNLLSDIGFAGNDFNLGTTFSSITLVKYMKYLYIPQIVFNEATGYVMQLLFSDDTLTSLKEI